MIRRPRQSQASLHAYRGERSGSASGLAADEALRVAIRPALLMCTGAAPLNRIPALGQRSNGTPGCVALSPPPARRAPARLAGLHTAPHLLLCSRPPPCSCCDPLDGSLIEPWRAQRSTGRQAGPGPGGRAGPAGGGGQAPPQLALRVLDEVRAGGASAPLAECGMGLCGRLRLPTRLAATAHPLATIRVPPTRPPSHQRHPPPTAARPAAPTSSRNPPPQYDKVVLDALEHKVTAKGILKGHLDIYRFCDSVWTFILSDATFRLSPTQSSSRRDEQEVSTDLVRAQRARERGARRASGAQPLAGGGSRASVCSAPDSLQSECPKALRPAPQHPPTTQVKIVVVDQKLAPNEDDSRPTHLLWGRAAAAAHTRPTDANDSHACHNSTLPVVTTGPLVIPPTPASQLLCPAAPACHLLRRQIGIWCKSHVLRVDGASCGIVKQGSSKQACPSERNSGGEGRSNTAITVHGGAEIGCGSRGAAARQNGAGRGPAARGARAGQMGRNGDAPSLLRGLLRATRACGAPCAGRSCGGGEGGRGGRVPAPKLCGAPSPAGFAPAATRYIPACTHTTTPAHTPAPPLLWFARVAVERGGGHKAGRLHVFPAVGVQLLELRPGPGPCVCGGGGR